MQGLLARAGLVDRIRLCPHCHTGTYLAATEDSGLNLFNKEMFTGYITADSENNRSLYKIIGCGYFRERIGGRRYENMEEDCSSSYGVVYF